MRLARTLVATRMVSVESSWRQLRVCGRGSGELFSLEATQWRWHEDDLHGCEICVPPRSSS
eukprot:514067-Amphidinium_carterae.1